MPYRRYKTRRTYGATRYRQPYRRSYGSKRYAFKGLYPRRRTFIRKATKTYVRKQCRRITDKGYYFKPNEQIPGTFDLVPKKGRTVITREGKIHVYQSRNVIGIAKYVNKYGLPIGAVKADTQESAALITAAVQALQSAS
jgi:hypothetical protein